MHDIAKQYAPWGPHRPGQYSDSELGWIYSWADINRKCNIFLRQQMSSLGVEREVGNPPLGGCQSKQSQKNETRSF